MSKHWAKQNPVRNPQVVMSSSESRTESDHNMENVDVAVSGGNQPSVSSSAVNVIEDQEGVSSPVRRSKKGKTTFRTEANEELGFSAVYSAKDIRTNPNMLDFLNIPVNFSVRDLEDGLVSGCYPLSKESECPYFRTSLGCFACGLSLPFSELVIDLLNLYCISPSQLVGPAWTLLRSCDRINHRFPLTVTVDVFRTQYFLQKTNENMCVISKTTKRVYSFYLFRRRSNRLGFIPGYRSKEGGWVSYPLIIEEDTQPLCPETNELVFSLSKVKYLSCNDDEGVYRDSNTIGPPLLNVHTLIFGFPIEVFLRLLGLNYQRYCLLKEPIPESSELRFSLSNDDTGLAFYHKEDPKLVEFNDKLLAVPLVLPLRVWSGDKLSETLARSSMDLIRQAASVAPPVRRGGRLSSRGRVGRVSSRGRGRGSSSDGAETSLAAVAVSYGVQRRTRPAVVDLTKDEHTELPGDGHTELPRDQRVRSSRKRLRADIVGGEDEGEFEDGFDVERSESSQPGVQRHGSSDFVDGGIERVDPVGSGVPEMGQLKTATLTLVLVALLIVALTSIDSVLCYLLAFLRKSP